MPALTPNQFSRRLTILLAIVCAAAVVILIRLFYWQVLRYDSLSQMALDQRERTITEYAKRGDILTSDGMLLATDVYGYEIAAHPNIVPNPQAAAALLAPLLNATEVELARRLQEKNQETVMLALNAPSEAGSKLIELRTANKLLGVDFLAKPTRRYPGGTLGAQILGFVNASRIGAYGLEQYYDEVLRGRDGQIQAASDAFGDESLPFDLPRGEASLNGSSLILTLNSAMQNIAERELSNGIRDADARSGQIIILDANTSAILAMASYPTPNVNAFSTTKLDEFTNPSVSLPYEPGSVFKVLTLSAGLDSGRIGRNITFNDTGSNVVGGRTIYNHDMLHPGVVDLVQFMQLSLNVEASKISVITGAKLFYQYLHDFGLGSLTGVDLAGEIPGTVKNPGDGIWYESDLGTNSFGQGIAVTPLQMANSIAAVANGGKLMRPYIVAKIVHPDGSVETREPRMVRRILKPETSAVVNDILSQSIIKESTNKAYIPGYTIAGKTGTAQIPIPGGYDPKWTIASFGGYLPVKNPQFVILVKIDRPSKSPWGSQVASPIFKQVAQQLVQLVGLPPDDVRGAQK